MKTEIEVKFCNIDIDDIRARLEKAGATCEHPMRLMPREVFHLVQPSEKAFVRVRDEGDKTTMTYKRFEGDDDLHAAREAEITVSDFETAVELLRGAGLKSKSYQETKRESWHLDDAEIVIDEWPWAPPFIEIEAESEDAVRDVAKQLGFDWNEAAFGGVATVYRKIYAAINDDIIVNDHPRYDFNDPVPQEFLGK